MAFSARSQTTDVSGNELSAHLIGKRDLMKKKGCSISGFVNSAQASGRSVIRSLMYSCGAAITTAWYRVSAYLETLSLNHIHHPTRI